MNTIINSEEQPVEQKKERSKRLLVIFFGIMLLLTFFSNTISNFTLPRVTIEYPSSGALIKDILAQGEVIPEMSQSEYTSLSTRVETVQVKAGETVKSGQLIMTLDNSEAMVNYQQEALLLRKLQISAEKEPEDPIAGNHSLARKRDDAKQKYDANCRNYERIKRMFEAGAETAVNYENAENAMNTSARDYQQADEDYRQGVERAVCEVAAQEIKVANLKRQLDTFYELRARCDGLVKEVNFSPGNLTNSAKPLFVIADQSQGFNFKIVIDSEQAAYLAPGDEFTVSLQAVNRGLRGKVTRLVSAGNGKEEIYLHLTADGLVGGEAGQAFISKEIGFYDYLVSNRAVARDAGGGYVWTVRERQGAFRNELYLEKINVSVINSDSSKTALQKGALDQETMIVSKVEGNRTLSDGCRVRLAE